MNRKGLQEKGATRLKGNAEAIFKETRREGQDGPRNGGANEGDV